MKLLRYITIACTAAFLAGCDYLDVDHSTGKTKDEMYAYFDNDHLAGLVNYIYSQLPHDLGPIDKAMRESATDNAVYTWNQNAIYKMCNGTWSSMRTVDDVWETYYTAIREANSFLENYSLEQLERFQWNTNYDVDIAKAKMYVYEVRALRAFYYLELAKRYGDIPLLKRTYSVDEINSVKKATFEQIIQFIVDECDAIALELPVTYEDFYGQTGRTTRGMMLSVKARALLYAASKLHNPSNDMEKWKAAAQASYTIIKEGWYSLPRIDEDPLYSKNGDNDVLASSQLIFERRKANDSGFEAANLPIGFEGGNSGNTPTQNLVDAFEMEDGTSFSWDNEAQAAAPYDNRDPRFYNTVLYNTALFMDTRIETYEGGKNASPVTGATLTGYYLRKFMNETISLSQTDPVNKSHHFILFRYAETLLNYAEAMNELGGPDYLTDLCPLSARAALNQVRYAARMPDVKDNGDKFTERLRNERRVELAFEDHRFWDIRRWMIGDEAADIYGVKITKSGSKYTYTRQKIQTHVWDDKMYLYPIPQNEVYVNENLTQNTGW